ncbi:hypothetical protein [Sphingomonas lacusdianchii]|uniref:hypothetical protein n=1 Tax=Sphingomonas lacusdianchii TaxID=2917992 RepID=UPI001F57D287|nr:hypothetical protein [Sphingomonas sp. JXJ CY 53]
MIGRQSDHCAERRQHFDIDVIVIVRGDPHVIDHVAQPGLDFIIRGAAAVQCRGEHADPFSVIVDDRWIHRDDRHGVDFLPLPLKLEQFGFACREGLAHVGEIGRAVGDRADESFYLALGLLDPAVHVASVANALRPAALHLGMIFPNQQRYGIRFEQLLGDAAEDAGLDR